MTERGLAQAECPTCGAVLAQPSALVSSVSVADEAALCEFPCPTCGRVLLIPVAPIEIASLLLLGAHKSPSLPLAPGRSSNRRAATPDSSSPDNAATSAHTNALRAATTRLLRRWCVCVPT